jgi:hypothetical protein
MNITRASLLQDLAATVLVASVWMAPAVYAADSAPVAASTAVPRPAYVQSTFTSPEEAAKALAAAMRTDERKLIWRVLGPGASKFIRSGDPVQDEEAREAFVAAYARATLLVGPTEFPFPYPLIMKNGRWQFDAKSGNEQVLDRRIGRNELSAIKVCLAYVDAQREYATQDRSDNGLLEYAQKLTSTPGTHDGLFWESKVGEPASPLGPAVANARSKGYGSVGAGEPYHGYFYKILTSQGKDAPGGAYDYVVNGKMIGGFALVAWPAEYGNSGLTTFIVNYEGAVYEKDLGEDTSKIASRMTSFNPDHTWKKVVETQEQK